MAEINIWMKEWLRQEMKEEDLDRRVNFASLSPPILPQGAGVLTSLQAQVVMAIKVGDRRFALSSIKRRGKIKKSVLDLFLSCLIFASFWHKARVFAENMLKKLIVADLSGFVHMRIMFLNAGCDFVMRRYWDPGGYLDSFACEGVDRYSGGDCECVVKNGVVLKQLKMLDESDFSVNDKLCHRMGHTTENILADILLLCCVDEGADVHQSAVLCCLGDIAQVCHVHLQPHLSAADFCEKSYLHNDQKQMVLDNLKGYAVRALVNAVDRVETVAAANLSPVWQGGAALDLHKEVLVSNVVEEQAMEVDMVVEDRVDVETLTVIHPWPEAILLGFQHYLVMLGTSVIIPTALVPMIRYPQMGGGNDEKVRVIQTLLFVAGINTLFQSFFGTRLPAVIGGSYTFVAPTISIILASRYDGVADPHEKFLRIMRGIQGSLLVASALQIIIGFSGLWRNITRFLIPLAAVPLVALVGFGLYELGFPGAAKCIEIGLPKLIALIIFSQYIPHAIHAKTPVFDRFAVIFSIAIIWVYAHLLTVGGAYKHTPPKTQAHCRTDRAGLIGAAPWIRIPYHFQWDAPTFNAGEAFAMMVAYFVSLVESTGTIIAVSRYASATPLPPSILSQGIGILLDGFFRTIIGFREFNSKFNCKTYMLRNLVELGFKEPTPIQRQAIPVLLSGRECFVCAPTGSGKTLAFLCPILMKLKQGLKDGVRAVILCPTRQLDAQTTRECKILSNGKKFHIKLMTKELVKCGDFEKMDCDVLVSTPLRIDYALKKRKLNLGRVEFLILDESDKLFELVAHEKFDEYRMTWQ